MKEYKSSVFGMRILTVLSIVLSVICCRPTYTLQKSEQKEYVFTDTTFSGIDSTLDKFIQPYREKMVGEMNTVLAESENALEKGLPESRLGNFVSDACMSESEKMFYPSDNHQADFAIFNTGGLRRSLPKGKITRGDVFELMPFENELVVLTMDGNLVKKISNFIASKNGAPVSGIRFIIKNKTATDIFIQGKPLDTLGTYKMLTSDYLANGGDSFELLKDVPRESVNLKVRDALIQYLTKSGKEKKIISINLDGRISNAQ